MSKVNILPDEIVSKIAAGEVIERPASVVKELVENALDAKATVIEIHLKDAGKALIRIVDNGTGIEKDDLEKIFLRHATSKISTAADLYSIMSLGFRGEALYSIAAIADIVLQSKTEGQAEGWETHVRGGEQLALKPCSFGTSGTKIEVKELFFNTPARKKFLKTNSTEINQILNTFIPYALLFPGIRFALAHQNKDLISLAPADSFSARLADALNLEERFFISAQHTFNEHNIDIRLVLGDINVKRTRRDMQFIFINDRPVENKNISYHMNDIYRLIMPYGEFPCFCVYIHMPADELDVNIHPTKREVKIKNERLLSGLLRSMAEQALLSSSQTKVVTKSPGHRVIGSNVVHRALNRTQRFERGLDADSSDFFEAGAPLSTADNYAYPEAKAIAPGESFIYENHLFERDAATLQSRLERARYIGPFINKFLLFESGRSLLLVDQHAAQERIMYEKLIRQMQNNKLEIQPLLSPIVLKLSPQEFVVWEETQDMLTAAGIEANQWDEQSIAVHAHPQLMKDPERAVRQILAGEKIEKNDFETLARRACRSSIMTGDTLKPEQAEYQREELLQCLDPLTCPHGRPTVIEIQESFLDKQFLRT